MNPVYQERRRNSRQRLLVGVRCRIAPGQSPEVMLTEISIDGCQVGLRKGLLSVGQYVVIKARGLEGLPGRVRWILGETAGIAFENKLHPAVLDHLLDGGPRPSTYRPKERSDQNSPANASGAGTLPQPANRQKSCL